jgi:hypothetical protein
VSQGVEVRLGCLVSQCECRRQEGRPLVFGIDGP